MKVVLQRVKRASVMVNGKVTGQIEKGIVALIGVAPDDDETVLRAVAEKMTGLRIFEDDEGKMNLSLNSVNGKILAISQFTLFADCRKGKRPSFSGAAGGQIAKSMYEKFVSICDELSGKKTETGVFGEDMIIDLTADGPVTIILNSDELNISGRQ